MVEKLREWSIFSMVVLGLIFSLDWAVEETLPRFMKVEDKECLNDILYVGSNGVTIEFPEAVEYQTPNTEGVVVGNTEFAPGAVVILNASTCWTVTSGSVLVSTSERLVLGAMFFYGLLGISAGLVVGFILRSLLGSCCGPKKGY